MKTFFTAIALLIASHNAFCQIALLSFEPTADVSGIEFGTKVVMANNDILVSSKSSDTAPGKVYLFNTNLQQTQVFYPNDAEIQDKFGSTLTIDDNFIAIGASDNDAVADNAGAVYVYKKNGSTYDLLQKITDATGRMNDHFGDTVKIQDGFLYVSAYGDEPNDENINTNRGSLSVYVFTGTEWVFSQKLEANEGASGDWIGGFAKCIAINNDEMVITSQCFQNYYRLFGVDWVFQNAIQIQCEVGGSPSEHLDNNYSEGQFLQLWQLKVSLSYMNMSNPEQHIEFPEISEYLIFQNFAVNNGRLFIGNSYGLFESIFKHPVLYYKKVGTQWEYKTIIYGNGPENEEDFFGSSLATDGGKAVFGAPKEGNGKAYYASESALENDSFSKSTLQVYPNPVKDVLKIKNELSEISEVAVYSVTGKLLMSVVGNPNAIDMTKLENGMYFVKISTADGNSQSFKIIKN